MSKLTVLGKVFCTLVGLGLILTAIYEHTVEKQTLEAIYSLVFGFGLMMQADSIK